MDFQKMSSLYTVQSMYIVAKRYVAVKELVGWSYFPESVVYS